MKIKEFDRNKERDFNKSSMQSGSKKNLDNALKYFSVPNHSKTVEV